MTVMEEIRDQLKEINKKMESLPAAIQVGEGEPAEVRKGTMTAKELADYLDVHKDTIYRQTKEGRIPHIKVGSRLLYPKASIQKWLLEKSQENHTREKEIDTSDEIISLLG